jgi:hypothetical protein
MCRGDGVSRVHDPLADGRGEHDRRLAQVVGAMAQVARRDCLIGYQRNLTILVMAQEPRQWYSTIFPFHTTYPGVANGRDVRAQLVSVSGYIYVPVFTDVACTVARWVNPYWRLSCSISPNFFLVGSPRYGSGESISSIPLDPLLN